MVIYVVRWGDAKTNVEIKHPESLYLNVFETMKWSDSTCTVRQLI